MENFKHLDTIERIHEQIDSLDKEINSLKSLAMPQIGKDALTQVRRELENEGNKLKTNLYELAKKVVSLQMEYDERLTRQVSTDRSAANLKKNMETLQKQFRDEQENTQQLRIQIHELNEQKEQLNQLSLQQQKEQEKQLNAANIKHKQLQEKNNKLENSLKEKETQMATCESTISSLQHTLEKQKKTKIVNFLMGILLGAAILSFIWFIPPQPVEPTIASTSTIDKQTDSYGYTEEQASSIDNTIYTGQTKDGLPHGIGTKKNTDGQGDKFVGSFKDGAFYYGVRTFENGKIYTGPYINNQANGVGSYQFGDGSRYIGEFKDNAMNGYGIYIDEKGNKTMGEFKNNNFIKGNSYEN
jgi:putative viral A-type inclusion protein